MNLGDAIKKAGQVLDQERLEPTVGYEAVIGTPAGTTNLASTLGTMALTFERGTHPRVIRENPREFQFKSINFGLLCAILDQVLDQERPAFFRTVCARVSDKRCYVDKFAKDNVLGAGAWKRCSSELPLVAEFLVRRGARDLFIEAVENAALSPGLTLLLLQMEEMIALNFMLFTEEDYGRIDAALGRLAKSIEKSRSEPASLSTLDSNIRYNMRNELPKIWEALVRSCAKARYLYLKGSLLPGMNLEVNQDKDTVRTFLEKLGFSKLLTESLGEVDRLYRDTATRFELKSSMGHLRSFIEQLHLQACIALQPKVGGATVSKWGEALEYLRSNNVLTSKEQQFAVQFYALMSDTGVHPLVAEREYVRLMRNMSIEYGLLLLMKLDKLGMRK